MSALRHAYTLAKRALHGVVVEGTGPDVAVEAGALAARARAHRDRCCYDRRAACECAPHRAVLTKLQ